MDNNLDYFIMFCPKCSRQYTVYAFETNPVCDKDGAGLSFVPREKQEGKGDDT